MHLLPLQLVTSSLFELQCEEVVNTNEEANQDEKSSAQCWYDLHTEEA
jgi:hypothetical protein